LAYLRSSQNLPGNSGWGLTPAYQGSALDSAQAVLACSLSGAGTNTQATLDFFKAVQLGGSDKGWALAQESTSDPATTALVVQALVSNKALYDSLTSPINDGEGTPAPNLDDTFNTLITDGVASLGTSVGTAAPIYVQAQAALAYIKSSHAASATSLLTSLASAQSSDGSWTQDVYATAASVRAMAASIGNDLPLPSRSTDIVYVPDVNLRTAINRALGKNSMDSLTKGDTLNLTTLYAEGMGIISLTGLEWAVNLTSADLRNNKITSTRPISGLPDLTSVQLDGNPVDTTVQPCSNTPVRILGKSFHTTLQAAYDIAVDGDVIQLQALPFTEDLHADRSVSVTLVGGYNCEYTANPDRTGIAGVLHLQTGAVVVTNVFVY
jgi:hypothetical protein